MQYPIIDNLIYAYLKNGWTGLDIPETITYEPIQLGSGDPSPDNIRPILPSKSVYIGGELIDIYGGVLDVENKTLAITKHFINMNDLTTWNLYSTPTTGVFRSEFQPLSNYTDLGAAPDAISNFAISKGYNPITRFDYGFFSINPTSPNILVVPTNMLFNDVNDFINNFNFIEVVYSLLNPITYNLTDSELIEILNSTNDIAHRLKLPLPHYFPHPVIDAIISASDGQQTEEENEILRHYLTPLGIGGI